MAVLSLRLSFGMLLFSLLPAVAQAQKPVPTVPTYADVKPILAARCVVCHKQAMLSNIVISGGLALDTLPAIKKGVVEKEQVRPVIVSSKSAESELYQRIVATSPSKLMPKGGPPLKPQEIALLKKWIDAGTPAGNIKEPPANTAPVIAPMPANPGTQDVAIATRLTPTADLVKKDTPKDARLTVSLKLGPLPPVTTLAFSPDGKTLAVGGYRSVTLWDTTTGKPATSLINLTGPVQSVAFRPDGAQLAVGYGEPGASGEVRVYDVKTFAPVIPTLSGHTDSVFSVAWSADGKRLATGSQDKTARVFEWPSGKELYVLRDHSDAVSRVAFAPDGKSLYTASHDRNIRRFNLEDGKLIRAFTGHGDAVTALALSPDGKALVTAGPEPKVRWWNPEDGNTTRQMDGHAGPINDLCFSKDGKIVASGGADKTVRLWDAGSGGQQRALEGSNDWVYSVAVSPDGKLTVGGSAEGVVRLWETANGRLRLSLISWPPDGKKSKQADWVAITPEGYFDGSAGWTALVRPTLAGKPVSMPRLTPFFASLRQPESVLKAWQSAPLEPPKLPEPPVAPAKTAKAANTTNAPTAK